MKVLILGVDGYLGWSLALHLAAQGHHVAGVDCLLRRAWVAEVGSYSAIPIYSIEERLQAFAEQFGSKLCFWQGDLLDYPFLKDVLSEFLPDTVVHLAEMPSAPYSMIDQAHATFTQYNNVIGSLNVLWAIKEVCPNSHLVKLGTMGEYGTPNIDIPEGFFEIEFRGRKDYLPFPRQANSFYHWSKVHDSNNIMFACRTWGISATDIMQGIVFGARVIGMDSDKRLRTRLDFDQCFGTAINRFVCQAVIGHPLTIYGTGEQVRGFLPLQDSMQCLTISIENPPLKGQYRVFNQFEACYSVGELATFVQEVGTEAGLNVHVQHYDNPRTEAAQHHYRPERKHLTELGYRPEHNMKTEIRTMFEDLLPHKSRILEKKNILVPNIRWTGTHHLSKMITRK